MKLDEAIAYLKRRCDTGIYQTVVLPIDEARDIISVLEECRSNQQLPQAIHELRESGGSAYLVDIGIDGLRYEAPISIGWLDIRVPVSVLKDKTFVPIMPAADIMHYIVTFRPRQTDPLTFK